MLTVLTELTELTLSTLLTECVADCPAMSLYLDVDIAGSGNPLYVADFYR